MNYAAFPFHHQTDDENTSTTSMPSVASTAATPCTSSGRSTYTSSSSTAPSVQQQRRDLLTVFQAAPLAWVSAGDDVPHPMKSIDFEFERALLTRTFEECGAGITVEYEIATTDRLGFFLARDEGHILHFSCHGHPDYLALEDDWGGMMMLEVSRLQEWIAAGGQNLQFVFVSACYSGMIGDAFVRAGVPHVLCCRHDSMLREDAAVEFERSFYRNLACGRTLQYAFDVACHSVMNCPRVPEEARAAEVQKFCLLPPDRDHNVEIFYQRPMPLARKKPFTPAVYFPPPPQLYMGREVDQYKVLQALQRSRLVRVSGDRGIGKSALVQSCCRYLNERLRMVDFQEILWIPSHQNRTETPFGMFEKVFDLIYEEADRTPVISFLSKAQECITRVVRYFRARKSLLVIDAKHILLENDITRLCMFIEELMRGTRYLKVLVIHHMGYEITTDRMPCPEQSIFLESLDISSSLDLFTRLCPHYAESPSIDLCGMLQYQLAGLPGQPQPTRMSKRLSDIFEMIGGGNPANIHRIAKHMPTLEYGRLLSLIQQGDSDFRCTSRAELLAKQKELAEEISKAALCRDFRKAEELQVLHDDLEAQKGDFPDLDELQQQFDEVAYQIELAVSAKDWSMARRLQSTLDKLENSIRLESDVENAFINESDAEVLQTRASLEAKLMQLDDDYEKACSANNFAKAREIDAKTKRLKSVRSQKPSRADYAKKAVALQNELDNAYARRNLDAAEMIYKRLVEVKAKLKLEEEAEAALGIRVGDDNTEEIESSPREQNNTRQESERSEQSTADTEARASVNTSRSSDPPGDPPARHRSRIGKEAEKSNAGAKQEQRRRKEEEQRQAPQKKQQQRRGEETTDESADSVRPPPRKPAATEDDSSIESDGNAIPGALKMPGISAPDESDNESYYFDHAGDKSNDIEFDASKISDDGYFNNANADSARRPQASNNNYPIAAELVVPDLDLQVDPRMERLIVATLKKNTVEAVEVTKDEKPSSKKGIRKFFKGWGKKKK